MKSLHSFFFRLFRYTRCTAILLATLVTLTWSSLAFCGDILIYNSIHDAAFDGDLEKVIALLNYHPELVSSKDKNGQTPLHLAVISGYMNG